MKKLDSTINTQVVTKEKITIKDILRALHVAGIFAVNLGLFVSLILLKDSNELLSTLIVAILAFTVWSFVTRLDEVLHDEKNN